VLRFLVTLELFLFDKPDYLKKGSVGETEHRGVYGFASQIGSDSLSKSSGSVDECN
jgi:hypothetical protein